MSNIVPIAVTSEPKKRGRRSMYTPELAASFLARLAGGMSVERICRHKDMPNKAQIYRWIGERSEFRDNFVRAMNARGIKHGDDVIAVAEKVLAGEIAPDVGRVAIEALKWAASRMAPKIYGDKIAHVGADGGDIGIRITDARAAIEGKLARLATIS